MNDEQKKLLDKCLKALYDGKRHTLISLLDFTDNVIDEVAPPKRNSEGYVVKKQGGVIVRDVHKIHTARDVVGKLELIKKRLHNDLNQLHRSSAMILQLAIAGGEIQAFEDPKQGEREKQ